MADPELLERKSADRLAFEHYLRKGQPMTPAVSADAALRWLRYKSEIRQNGKVVGYSDDEEALRGYNGRNDFSRQSGSLPHKTWYAKTIIDMAKAASK